MIENLIEGIFTAIARCVSFIAVFLLANLLVGFSLVLGLSTWFSSGFRTDAFTAAAGVALTPAGVLGILYVVYRPAFQFVWRFLMVWRTKVLARHALSASFRDLRLDAQTRGEVFKAPGIGRVRVR